MFLAVDLNLPMMIIVAYHHSEFAPSFLPYTWLSTHVLRFLSYLFSKGSPFQTNTHETDHPFMTIMLLKVAFKSNSTFLLEYYYFVMTSIAFVIINFAKKCKFGHKKTCLGIRLVTMKKEEDIRVKCQGDHTPSSLK